jgi:ATP-binding cassette subfamily B protein
MQRVAEVLELDPDTADRPDAVVTPPLRGEIRFEQVAFAYPDGTAVLHDVSFTIHPGERVALVGPSGSGKSTIASMILRLYDPDTGTVKVDGMDIRALQVESLRDQIAVVLQDSVLFGATIRENIAYGRLEATEEEILDAARTAGAHEFIHRMPEGYESIVGERGATLSGGQRQRIAIARALVRDPAILILDEPMTGLDPAMRTVVADALEPLMDGRTCLMIAHDVDTVARADRVLRLEDGRVATEYHADPVETWAPHVPEPPRGLVAGLIERAS